MKQTSKVGKPPGLRRISFSLRGSNGATAVEYAVLLGFLGVALILGIALVQQGVGAVFGGASGDLAVTASYSPPTATPTATPTDDPTDDPTGDPTDDPTEPPTQVGIDWANATYSGGSPNFICDYVVVTAVTCTATNVGNRGTFEANVRLVDASQVAVLNPDDPVEVTVATSGSGGLATTTGETTIAQDASTTPGTFKLTLNNGNPPPTTITASAVVGGVTYRVSTTVSK